MPVVKNAEAREIPWRPGYRNYVLAGEAEGVSVSSSLGVLEQGAGAPLGVPEVLADDRDVLGVATLPALQAARSERLRREKAIVAGE